MKKAIPDFENIEDVREFLLKGYDKHNAIMAVSDEKGLNIEELEELKEYFRDRGVF